MMATAHARIDVLGGKISLEVGKEQVIFNANEEATPITVSPICVIKNFDVIDNIDRPDDLEEFLMNDNLNGDLGSFLRVNNLFPNFETNSPFPDKYSIEIWSPTKGFQDSDNDFGSRIDELVAINELVAIDDLWGDLDPGALKNKQPLKPESHSIGNRVNRYNPYNLQITCKIGGMWDRRENVIVSFVVKWLGRAKCDLLLNNICEVFNRQLVDDRDQPIIICLEYIKEYLMKRIVVVQKVIAKTVAPLTPYVTAVFDAIKKSY
ncbi:hypothetical protein Tco_0438262 [Tanacetum coccineum]